MSKPNSTYAGLVEALNELSIVPSPKPKHQGKTGIIVLELLCMVHLGILASKHFDSTLPVDDILDVNGRIKGKNFLPPVDEEEDYFDDFESEMSEMSESDSEIPEEISVEEYDQSLDWDLKPSEVCDVSIENDGPQAWVLYQFSNSVVSEAAQAAQTAQDYECKQIVNHVKKRLSELDALAESMMAITISFSKILGTVAKSGNFDLDVFKSFLEEFVILLDTMFAIDIANDLPKSWSFFKELAKLQCEVFDIYLNAITYQCAHDLIWIISNNTSFQKEFLHRCIIESVGFEGVMSEVGAAIESMLSLQDEFIVKLIARLQASKDDQASKKLKWVVV